MKKQDKTNVSAGKVGVQIDLEYDDLVRMAGCQLADLVKKESLFSIQRTGSFVVYAKRPNLFHLCNKT